MAVDRESADVFRIEPETDPPEGPLPLVSEAAQNSFGGAEIKVGKGANMRCVFLRQIVRQLIERGEGEEIRICGLGNAIQETCSIYNLLKDFVVLHQLKTKQISTERTRDLPQLRIHFSLGPNFKIPYLLRPRSAKFLPAPASFTPIYDCAADIEAALKADIDAGGPAWLGAKGLHFGSINAGSEELFVGGSAINAAFKTALTDAGLDTEAFKDFHTALWEKAKSSVGRVISADEKAAAEVGLAYASCRTTHDGDKPTGACFVEVFTKDKRPMKCEKNAAMVYVIGPKGSDVSSKKAFIWALRDCGKNIVVSVNQYNLRHAERYSELVPRIDQVRVCLVSGGVYRHPDATKKEIARALMEGLFLNPSAQFDHSPVFEFAFDEDVFKEVYGEMFVDSQKDLYGEEVEMDM